ncbi:MAG: hypothetical protein U0325_19715 [Polyangiales bacterium]
MRLYFGFFLVVCGLAACGAPVTTGSVCLANVESTRCDGCPEEQVGFRTCNADGTGYGICVCSECSLTRSCPSGRSCVQFNGASGSVCARTCNTSTDCGSARPCCGDVRGQSTRVCAPQPATPGLCR